MVETMKWSMPAFEHHGLLCQMAAFKGHCTFGFWKGKLVLGEAVSDEKAMGQMGRIESVKDLPAKRVLVGWVKKAALLNEAGVKAPRVEERKKKKVKVAEVKAPADLVERLKEKAVEDARGELEPWYFEPWEAFMFHLDGRCRRTIWWNLKRRGVLEAALRAVWKEGK